MYTQKFTPSRVAVPSGIIASVNASKEAGLQLSPVHRVQSKDMIYAQGDESGQLYIVEYGCVCVSRLTEDGRRLVMSFNFAGDIFGFESGAERQSYAEAMETSGTRMITQNKTDASSIAVMNLLLDHFNRVQDHLLILGTQNSTERVAAFLLELAERQGDAANVRLPMGRNDIADYLGLTLETVSRALHRLQDIGLIVLRNARSVRIKSRNALRTMGG